ncbi:hypothetical protein NRS6186_22230 (plasmid) [Bacillus subtilis]|uniref:Phage related protein n=2 Tax=Bacillus subtilis TaxID=1423 RepID=S5DW02_BACIU|nr:MULTISPECIES: hypothetical protein [Bacillus]MBU8845684.1 hypothetical protein [Alkalicoccobacillus gibsonii]AGQ21249.1 phage related protein [Bacillus subtilis subsp. subtilis NCIB 3610 = ATCC 6051 = DSM 10]AQZ93162.1 hypothetical protein B4U62_22150 [Bacillus subtilis]AXF35638.1 hypothetical protein DS740_22475 [Bacillus sp. DM2]MBA4562830.1 hypothetical protein [Bacillus subtilis subsp. subtilis]
MITRIEQQMLDKGISSFTQYDMNTLIVRIADKLGKLPYEITEDVILQHHKNLKNDLLSEACEEEIIKGFTASNGHVYRTNRDDQVNMIGQKDILDDTDSAEPIKWRTEDAGWIDHTKDEWLQIYKEAFDFKKSTLLKYASLKDQVNNATTHDEIVKITV